MRRTVRQAVSALFAVTLFSAAAVGHAEDKKITLGFAQVGAESAWRTANTVSVKQAAKDAGINLKFSDAQQKQENQIKAIRSYIAQKVDVIAFSPVVESGWEPVLQEAKRAHIPVVLTDRNIDVKDKDLYVTMIGSDFLEEGRRAGKWLEERYKNDQGPINIAELQGTVGSAPANDRHSGLMEVIKNDPKFKIIASQSGDFTLAGGKQVMEAFVKTYGKKINVVYAHNDDMALGAIQAMEEAGIKPGKDVSVVSFDATKGGFQAMMAGKINVDVECSPLLGPQLMSAVKDIVAGKQLPKRIVTNETVFPMETAAQVFPQRKY
ncbi:ABC transporter substrate-binding protein [Trinickia caryophylli]|uniref:Monosaccharide ABC transporter substrate-binding protein, CUT2 family n=1 Tax=Trinickia caryophylli TaxID=28094 RepID=A0A1X7D1E4_TRICW|nr:ABC transporter substrate-binding protein [Trinickia caryophylli]PMS13577.1 LacI family transcriptional regulator [Trinickia caryophylli]TRX15255.1 ABC transporter substrate-binding protein [Trinickia caryophylli]WQE15130.1 ABC transporter substrate-binding protein [Trinickia caryophylli]SMF06882.1 monosaccharide ABC transporter substrate-binding protein, CUT2 family [Trinickia caryophylli]GLU31133.1 LacI family transcriptional regulator [Trinickia caryophylli]